MAKKILFINQEIYPYVPETEQSSMGKKLPMKMQEEGYEIRTFTPKWGNINERRGQLHEVIRLSGMNLIIDDVDHPLIIKVASIPQTRLQVYFIDNDDYFMKRLMARDAGGEEYDDNGERAIFFARGVLETVKKLRWTPDIIHCQGWMSAVIPMYIKKSYKKEPIFANVKVITSLYADDLTKSMGKRMRACLDFKGVDKATLRRYKDDFDVSEMKRLAIDFSDAVVETGEGVDKALLSYAIAKNVPLYSAVGEAGLSKYKEIYEQVLEK